MGPELLTHLLLCPSILLLYPFDKSPLSKVEEHEGEREHVCFLLPDNCCLKNAAGHQILLHCVHTFEPKQLLCLAADADIVQPFPDSPIHSFLVLEEEH